MSNVRSFHVVQRVKDSPIARAVVANAGWIIPGPWPGNFYMPRVQQKKKKKRSNLGLLLSCIKIAKSNVHLQNAIPAS